LIVYLHQLLNRRADLLGSLPKLEFIEQVVDYDARGHGAKDRVFQQIESHFGLSANTWQLLVDDFYTYFPDTCVPFPKLHQTLQTLVQKGFALGLVTNGQSTSQNPKIDGLGIRLYFQVVLVSESVGVRKPDPKIFHMALEALQIEPSEAVFVGDNPLADVAGAKAVGMRAIWVEDDYWEEPAIADSKISQLSDLPDLVDQLSST
jgi:putative hydrolase of the HAD superfamily